MRILLINPKISNGKPWLPLGLGYVAAFLRRMMPRCDLDIKIIDKNLREYNSENLRLLIRQFKPNVVGITGMTVQAKDAIDVGKAVKKVDKDLRLVYGGVHFTFRPEDGLEYGDIVVIGEGEETFLEVCKGRPLYRINGIAYKEDNKITLTKPRNFIQDLDIIPFPAYDLLEMDKYDDHFITGENAISIMTGRGCPFNCVFCASPQLWRRKVRYHSLEYVMLHIDYLIKMYDLKNLRIMDDTFTLNKKRVFDFCDLIEERGYRLNMACLTHPKCAEYEMFERMKEAGFSIIAFGVESGNEKVLKMINKGVTKDDVKNAVFLAKRAGLSTELLFMIGNIGENQETIRDSIAFAKEINPPSSNTTKNAIWNWFQFATPIPGSLFFDSAKRHGQVLTYDWSRYHHREPIFIPEDLDREMLIKLRDQAFKETNAFRFSWVPTLIRKNTAIQKLYNYIRNTSE